MRRGACACADCHAASLAHTQILDADPSHKEAARELLRCKRALKEQDAKDAALFSKMWKAKPAAPATPAAETTPAA